MKIKTLILENFRGYQQRTEIPFANLTAFIGKNDVGKSTVLDALDIFFENTKPEQGDACVKGDAKNVLIGVTFVELPQQLNLDRGASSTLVAEHLLNSEGNLEIHKVFNLSLQRPGAPKVYAIAVHPTAERVSDILQRSNAELKKIVKEQGLEANCNQAENPSMRQAIYATTQDLRFKSCEVPLNEDNGKAVWAALQKRLPVFALFHSDRSSSDQDPEVQNPMKAAIRKALAEIEAELEAVTLEVQKRAEETAKRTLTQLQATYPDLSKSLTPKFRPPAWQRVFNIDLESDDGVPLNKRGSGVRRLVLMSFFQAEAVKKREERLAGGDEEISVIYAIEEPETSQHPDNQERIVEALCELAEAGEQVVITTHVPALAGLMPLDSLRYIDLDPDTDAIRLRAGSSDVYSEIASALGVLPDPLEKRTARVAVLVEGKTDVDALISLATVLSSKGEIPLLDHSRIFWALGGGETLKDWVERRYLDHLGLPQVHLFDSDRTSQHLPMKKQKEDRLNEVNARDGCCAFMTRKREIENYIHPDAILRLTDGNVVFPDQFDPDFSDVPSLFAESLKNALTQGGFEFHPMDHNGKPIPVRKANAKKILTSYVMREMTVEEIKTRCSYEENQQTRYEIIEWLGAIQSHCNQ